MPARGIPHPTMVKIRDAFSSIMRSAVKYRYIVESPLKALELPRDNREVRAKPFIYPAQFQALVDLMDEPYATMVYVAVWTGLRVSELLGAKWRDIHGDCISIERRFCRGDWSQPKTKNSAGRVAVDPAVIARVQCLKTLTVEHTDGPRRPPLPSRQERRTRRSRVSVSQGWQADERRKHFEGASSSRQPRS
jgi:hypothetical protein